MTAPTPPDDGPGNGPGGDPCDGRGPGPGDGRDDSLVLDLTGVTDRQAFMDRCTVRLCLPGWFGRNWDALADCLTDLSWWPADPGGRTLRVHGWQDYAAAKPREWRIVKEVLRDAETFWRGTDTELTVLMEQPDDAEQPELSDDRDQPGDGTDGAAGDDDGRPGLAEGTNGSGEGRDVRP